MPGPGGGSSGGGFGGGSFGSSSVDTSTGTKFLDSVFSLADSICETSKKVFEFLSTDLETLLSDLGLEGFSSMLNKMLEFLQIDSVSILELIIGNGLFFVLIFWLFKWLKI